MPMRRDGPQKPRLQDHDARVSLSGDGIRESRADLRALQVCRVWADAVGG